MTKDLVEASERLNAVFGAIGTLAIGFAVVAIIGLVFVWRALRKSDTEHTQTLVGVVNRNTESNERSAAAQREAAGAVGRLGETLDRLGEGIRDGERRYAENLAAALRRRRGRG